MGQFVASGRYKLSGWFDIRTVGADVADEEKGGGVDAGEGDGVGEDEQQSRLVHVQRRPVHARALLQRRAGGERGVGRGRVVGHGAARRERQVGVGLARKAQEAGRQGRAVREREKGAGRTEELLGGCRTCDVADCSDDWSAELRVTDSVLPFKTQRVSA